MSDNSNYDAVVVGAGHNGLTTASYLSRSGLKTLVLERRDIVGGCAVTEEIDPDLAPGCRVSTRCANGIAGRQCYFLVVRSAANA